MSRRSSVTDFINHQLGQALLPGALNKPRYNKIRYSLRALQMMEWMYDNPSATFGVIASLGILDLLTKRIMPRSINFMASLTANYALPIAYMLMGLGAGYFALHNYMTGAVSDILPDVPNNAITRYMSLSRLRQRIATGIKRELSAMLRAVDAQADSVVGLIASTYTPESSEMWPGWISWIISVVGGSNPADSISDSDTRLMLDSLERDLMTNGLKNPKTMMHCYNVFVTHGDQLNYHTASAKGQLATKYQSILGLLAKHIADVNQHTQGIYVLLDKIEERLLLKPGLLTSAFDRMVQTLYNNLYATGHSLGLAPSVDRRRVYVAVPPFAKERREAATLRMTEAGSQRDELDAYTAANRFSRSVLQRKRAALRILEGESIAHLCMMTQDYYAGEREAKGEDRGCEKKFTSQYSARKLVRVAALLSGHSQSRYLYQFGKGELTLQQAHSEIVERVPSESTGQRANYRYPRFEAVKDGCMENYFVRAKQDRLARIEQLTAEQMDAELLQSLNQEIGDRQLYITRFFAVFGQGGLLERAGGRLSSVARVNLATLQNDADRIFNNHHLMPDERQCLLQALIRHHFPAHTRQRDGLSRFTHQLGYFNNIPLNAALLDGLPAHTPITNAMLVRLNDHTPQSINMYNTLNRQLNQGHGLFDVSMIGAINASTPLPRKQAHQALKTMVSRVQSIAFSGVLSEDEKLQEICTEMTATLRHLRAVPYAQLLLSRLIGSAFSAEQNTVAQGQLESARFAAKRNTLRLLVRRARQIGAARVAHGPGAAAAVHAGPSAEETSSYLASIRKAQANFDETIASSGYQYLRQILMQINVFDLSEMNRCFDLIVSYYGNSVGMFARNHGEIKVLLKHHDHFDRGNICTHPMWQVLSIAARQFRKDGGRKPSKLTGALFEACHDLHHPAMVGHGHGAAMAVAPAAR